MGTVRRGCQIGTVNPHRLPSSATALTRPIGARASARVDRSARVGCSSTRPGVTSDTRSAESRLLRLRREGVALGLLGLLDDRGEVRCRECGQRVARAVLGGQTTFACGCGWALAFLPDGALDE